MSRRAVKNSVPLAFEGLRSDYAASKQSRFRRIRTGIYAGGSSADYHYRSDADYLRMLEYARDMDRNDAAIGQMVDRAVMNTVQNGMVPDPDTGNDEANKIIADLWYDWSTDPLQCDLAGQLTFIDQTELVFRHALVDGDIFANLTNLGQLELIESHRCRTPSNTKKNVVHGILLSETRERLEAWFTKDDIDPHMGLSRVGDTQAIPFRDAQRWPNLVQVYNPKRVSQTRGVTALAPVFDVAGMFEDINFAKLVQQQIISCFAILREMAAGETRSATPQTGGREYEEFSDGVRKIVEDIAPGMEVVGQPGETLKGFAPNIPNPGAMEHFRLMLTLLGVNLGLPLVMVTMDASDTNFSGWRGAVDQARMGFKRNQRWLIDHFLTPVYRWKVRQWSDPKTGDPRLKALAAKIEAANGNLYWHTWTTPKWPYIQPLQDAQADALRVEKRQISPRRQLAERGFDVDEIRNEIIADNRAMIEAAVKNRDEIVQKFPSLNGKLDWHELIYVPNATDQKPGLPGSPNTIDAGEGQPQEAAA